MRYFATLGYTPRVLDDVDGFVGKKPDITIFHGDPTQRQRAANKRARAKMERIGLPFRFVQVEQPWDFRECFEALCTVYRQETDDDIVVNASGGTEVMNSAASVFGLLTGAECRFLNRRTAKTHVIDMSRLRMALDSPGNRKAIIEEAARRGGQVPLADLPARLRVTQGAVTQLVENLVWSGLATVEPREDARGKRVSLAASLWPLVQVNRRSGP